MNEEVERRPECMKLYEYQFVYESRPVIREDGTCVFEFVAVPKVSLKRYSVRDSGACRGEEQDGV